jgi:hypothetical protein
MSHLIFGSMLAAHVSLLLRQQSFSYSDAPTTLEALIRHCRVFSAEWYNTRYITHDAEGEETDE